ncbi:MAG: hypothetical protein K2Y37_12395 [Pirellulales bacterium]|nr:hypothetical protein [Pirellulales bacterium]
MTDVAAPAPARPRKLKAQYEVVGDRLRVFRRRRQWFASVFMALWLTGWTVGCVVLAAVVVQQREVFMLLFAVPFWAAWFFVAAMLIGQLLNFEEFELDREGARHRAQALVVLSRRELPLWELRTVEVAAWQRSENSDSPPEVGLVFRTWGRPLRVFAGLPEAELRWLADQLTKVLDVVRRATQSADLPDMLAKSTDDAELPLQLAPSDMEVPPPSDCQWTLTESFQAIELTSRGRWSWGAVLGLLFINCFWNGIVCVFVAVASGLAPGGPQGWERLGLIVFLTPFVAIGLLMFVGLVMTIAEPVRRTSWRVSPREIECRWRWFGYGPRWTYPIDDIAGLDRIELDKSDGNKRGRLGSLRGSWPPATNTNDCPYRLSLIRRDNVEVCEIGGLTEGEARWIADQVQRSRLERFR